MLKAARVHTLLVARTCWMSGQQEVKRTVYQRKVDVDMLNAVKSMLAVVSSAVTKG